MTPGMSVTPMATAPTAAWLKQVTPTADILFYMAGGAAMGDGTSGIYRWKDFDTTTENLTTYDVIASNVTSASGRWLRVKNRIDTLSLRMTQTKRVTTPAVAAGLSVNINVTWDTPFPNTNYTIPTPGLESANLLGVNVGILSKSMTGCVLVLKNALLLSLLQGAGNLNVVAIGDLM